MKEDGRDRQTEPVKAAVPFGDRLSLWILLATIPVYFTVWFLACRGDGLVLNMHGGLCALGYTIGYMLALRRGDISLSVDGVAFPLALLGCATSLALFHRLDMWPLDQRETFIFVIKGMVIAFFLAHIAGAAVYGGIGTLLERVFKERIEAEKLNPDTRRRGI